jgi:hypothetical protein
MRVPGLACGSKLRYRLVGDRTYTEDSSSIELGTLKVVRPSMLARQWQYGLGIGGGYGGSGSPYKPFGTITAFVRYRPVQSTGYGEVRGSWVISAQPYDGFAVSNLSETPSVLFNRFFLEAAGFVELAGLLSDFVSGVSCGPKRQPCQLPAVGFLPLAVGFSVGTGIGYAYFDSDVRRVGDVRPYVSFGPIARVKLSRVFSVEGALRMFPEQRHSFVAPDQESGKASRGNPVEHVGYALATQVGIEFLGHF